MPIPSPILDDRSYQQLRDELVRRIPVYTPEWTDHNPSDPGITLIELFSFLAENLLFRFNQIPETARLEFLRLLQIPLRPAVPARALVTLSSDKLVKDVNGKYTGQLVPMQSELKAGAFPFETLTEVAAWPISFVTIGRVTTKPPDPTLEPEVAGLTANAVDAAGINAGEDPIFYESRTVDLNEPPVDFDSTVDGMLWVAVLNELKKSPDASVADIREFFKDGLLNLGFVPEPIIDSIEQVKACPGVDFQPTAPAVEWQVSTGEIINNEPVYSRLAVEGDTTLGLSREGVVRLRLPKKAKGFGQFKPEDPNQLGTGQFPPALDEEKEKKLLCWLRVFRHDGSGFGKVLLVGANAAEAVQTKKARTEFLGAGNGQPDQRCKLASKPVLARSLKLDVEEGQRWVEWSEVDGFYSSQPDDRHFVVDLEVGEVRFGNGLQGLAPQIGQRIRAREYRYGGGVEGNVAAKGISKLVEFPDIKAANPLAARGGAAAESIREGLSRIPGELRRRDRAVTATDFQELAIATPGADVGRAECLPRFHPQFRSPSPPPEKAGVVSVVIWPREDSRSPNAPVPDRAMLRAVCEWLDLRRLVTTELYVIPPTYRRIAVVVGLQAKPGYGIEAVRHWVELVIRQYLSPLPPYGPEGHGWPLGRRVHGPELEAAALQVEGVEFLNELKVAGWNGSQWTQGTVNLEKYEVPELAEIAVVEGPL
ncbi:MAG TPA: putative baseplate assembly protein, partial [Pyrinomonadaceae bacterium]|nr:putative baseplate assembly protein [Pyrinomonadaceae bacterium]